MNSDNNIYKEDVDFAGLASQDVEFKNILKPNGQLDFSDPESVQQLTKSLLNRDFGLKLTLPPDRLCPAVPNRLNYLLWIQDLLDTSAPNPSLTDTHDPSRPVIGLDVGTGASAIYPLLGCKHYSTWRFACTDTDPHSLTYARQNITQNNLSNRIRLLQTEPEGPLLPLDDLGLDKIDFTLTNPPFFTSPDDLLASATLKSRPPSGVCTGAPSEMVTPGGETAFVARMIAESVPLGQRVRWFTAQLGKLGSVATVVKELRERGVKNWAVGELVQGRTKRWVVGWSWVGWRPAVRVARGASGVAGGDLPFPSEVVVTKVAVDGKEVGRRVDEAARGLGGRWKWDGERGVGMGFVARNTWSRAARRKAGSIEEEGDEMAFGFRIYVKEVPADARKSAETEVVVRWLKGDDSVLFESFCGMIKRKVEAQ
ncbi:hypothetical protein V493_03368 [Pseudogymnoascus sp. VKM F-4281 (FW-2241)]|nr:hypothetical protein V493_03368 [Pseudogymnoascus sp. VKM F-4281 (FW-2241)]